MKKIVLVVIVVLGLFVSADFLPAEECPEIDAGLRFELYKNFPQSDIAFPELFSPQELREMSALKGDSCPQVAAIDSFLYVILLKDREASSYRIVQAATIPQQTRKVWTVRELDVFADDIPIPIKARGGFYADVDTGNRITVTRHSKAVQVRLVRSGQKLIYKIREDGEGFEKCRIR